MRNPFEEIMQPRLDNPRGEEVEGSFSCQEAGCYGCAHEARYLHEVKILTWECPDGHINKIEGFKLDG